MRKCCILISLLLTALNAMAQTREFCIAKDTVVASIVVDESDWAGVKRAATDLSADINRVTGIPATIRSLSEQPTGNIIVGTIGKSKTIDKLIKKRKLNVDKVRGEWESYIIEVIDGNLVIAGSDKRGTIYGIYTISEHIGVSPWYWWADVPVQHQNELYWNKERLVQPSPKVKYRGIFINDEWPSFGGWSNEHFGGINSKMYAHMFELLLRLKANYLWPAMWDSAFNEDDPESPRLADEYGIVMGTSHHEPMMRAHKEYTRRKDEVGAWDYATNPENIKKFFTEGIERNKNYENLITIGMRGDGDVAMGTGNDADNMKTLEEVVKVQRDIISKAYKKPASKVPQMWAIFTEVQRYYDAGFTVPDDVTLMFCDNNWGYIRRIGRDFERERSGGLGLYYHIDMNGGPWNDRWINTTTIPKLREQLNLAYQTGIDRIWLINVGDLKPKEVPIDFIMEYAWDPDAIQPGDEQAWLEQFAADAFGHDNAKEAAYLISKYTKYNLWRKPEVQVAGIFNTEEMNYTDSLWLELSARAEALRTKIPAEAQDAYYELVYYPVVASANVALIYNATTRGNKPLVEQLMVRDQQLSDYYHHIAGGKWSAMMQDKHIGYTRWSMPDNNVNPTTLRFNTAHVDAVQPTTEYSIPAYKYSNNIEGDGAKWIMLPDLGRGEGCMGSSNVLAENSQATLEYEIDIDANGTIAIGILPTQDVNPARGLRIGIQVDNAPLQIIDARRGIVDTFSEYTKQNLEVSKVLKPLPPRSKLALSGYWNGRQQQRRDEVFDNIRWLDATFTGMTPGKHTLKIVMIDPEIVVEQIVVNPDNSHYSYFGANPLK